MDGLSAIFQLAPEQVAASQSVLKHFGNLSSATIFFVLEALRQRWRQHPAVSDKLTGVAMAFGPGLVIEMARLAYIPPVLPSANGKVPLSQLEAADRGKIA